MPKKQRSEAFNFSAFLNELAESKTPDKRKEGEKKERKYFLIVCEGERTEPSYFEAFRQKLPPNMLDTIDIVGEGANTLSVVNKAIQFREIRSRNPVNPNFDEVWAVFDRDSFPSQRVNEAIAIAKTQDVHCAFSNEAFELWYLLHFIYFDAAIRRHRYIDMLNEVSAQQKDEMSHIF